MRAKKSLAATNVYKWLHYTTLRPSGLNNTKHNWDIEVSNVMWLAGAKNQESLEALGCDEHSLLNIIHEDGIFAIGELISKDNLWIVVSRNHLLH